MSAGHPSGEDIPWARVTNEMRLSHLGSLFVERPLESEIHALFDRVRGERAAFREPTNIVIIGETGVGKSDLMARYLQKHPPFRRDGCLVRPVLLVELRNLSTPRSVARHMLEMLGLTDSGFLGGSTPELTARVKKQMIAQHVELCILDEFNNTLSDDGRVRSSRVAEWIKDLSKSKTRTGDNPHGLMEENIPFAMVGTRKTARIIDPIDNPELASLTPYVLSVPRYVYASDGEKREFRDFLANLDQELPFDEFSGLGSEAGDGTYPLADKIHVATHGLLRQVGYLIRHAAASAISDGSDRIHERHLHRSVEEQRALLQSAMLDHDRSRNIRERPRPVDNPFAAPLKAAVRNPTRKRGFQEAA